jgi:hypothetical protein
MKFDELDASMRVFDTADVVTAIQKDGVQIAVNADTQADEFLGAAKGLREKRLAQAPRTLATKRRLGFDTLTSHAILRW